MKREIKYNLVTIWCFKHKALATQTRLSQNKSVGRETPVEKHWTKLARCDTRFGRVFTACVCVFKFEITVPDRKSVATQSSQFWHHRSILMTKRLYHRFLSKVLKTQNAVFWVFNRNFSIGWKHKGLRFQMLKSRRKAVNACVKGSSKRALRRNITLSGCHVGSPLAPDTVFGNEDDLASLEDVGHDGLHAGVASRRDWEGEGVVRLKEGVYKNGQI